MSSWKKNIVWLLFVIGIVVAMSFVETSQQTQVSGLPDVKMDVHEDMLFLSKEDVIEKLKDKGLVSEEKVYSELDLQAVEDYLNELPEVKEVEVFTYLGESWTVDVTFRRPIARLFNLDGSSCYLDNDGTLMPLSSNYSAYVLMITGNINETDYSKNVTEIMNNDSLKTIEILDDLYDLSTYVCSDEFLSAQFTQIHVNTYNEFELIPRVGDHRVMFGDADHTEGKFKKLELFYTEGLSRAGWEEYDTINVMFKDRVVCSKR